MILTTQLTTNNNDWTTPHQWLHNIWTFKWTLLIQTTGQSTVGGVAFSCWNSNNKNHWKLFYWKLLLYCIGLCCMRLTICFKCGETLDKYFSKCQIPVDCIVTLKHLTIKKWNNGWTPSRIYRSASQILFVPSSTLQTASAGRPPPLALRPPTPGTRSRARWRTLPTLPGQGGDSGEDKYMLTDIQEHL